MKLEIKTAQPYCVTIESGVLDRIGEIALEVEKPGAKAMIVSETNVFPLYGGRVTESLQKAGFTVCSFVYPAGESSKQMSTICEIYQALAEHGFTRTDFIVALGGGVTGDMGGFAAATFLRGMSFIQAPTSLLAQVDASVGGKTGVDLPFGKNLVGAFHQPSAVVTDPETLKTLPEHYFRDGMGEVIKHGCIDVPMLFEALERGTALDDLASVLAACVDSKRRFVEEDTKDTGRRMILNFGHTFGHALEKLHGFRDLSHGEAVGIGMLYACRAGEALGVTAPGTEERVRKVLEQYGMPTSDKFTVEEIVDATVLDKKSDGDTLRLILISEIGKGVIYPIGREKLLQVLKPRKTGNTVWYGNSFSGGEVTVPPSKSAAHRALLCAALSRGKCTVSNIDMSKDMEATLNAVRALGVRAEYDAAGKAVALDASGLGSAAGGEIDCLESGSTLRFFIPIAAALGGAWRFTGRGRLPQRPLGVYQELLPDHGAVFRRPGEDQLPLELSGKLEPGVFSLPGNVSSQFVTGLLFALPLLEDDSEIVLTAPLESKGYVDLTISILQEFGISVRETPDGWHIPGGQSYRARDYTVEGDWSQAAFFLSMAALDPRGGKVRIRGLDPDSAQGDKLCVPVFSSFGLSTAWEGEALTAVNRSAAEPFGGLHGQEIDVSQIPDLLPALSVCAAFSEGETRFVNAGRLRLKESDRVEAMENAIRAFGGRARSQGDTLIVSGVPGFEGGRAEGCGDHRVVMALAAAALRCKAELAVTDAQSISKSYPDFFEDFRRLGGVARVVDLG